MSTKLSPLLDARATGVKAKGTLSTVDQRGRLRINQVPVAVAATDIDEVGDKIVVCALPSTANVVKIEVAATDGLAASGFAFDLGLAFYDTGDTMLNQTAYADGSAILDGGSANQEVPFTDASMDAAGRRDRVGDFVWQDAGLSEDFGRELFLVMTVAAAATTPGAATISFRVTFVVD